MSAKNEKLGEGQGNQGVIYKAGILISTTMYMQHSDPDVNDTAACSYIWIPGKDISHI